MLFTCEILSEESIVSGSSFVCNSPASRFFKGGDAFFYTSIVRSCDRHRFLLVPPFWSPISFSEYLVLYVMLS